eukprot:g4071.t1
MQRSNSVRSDTTGVTDEPQEEHGKPMPMPLARRRSSGNRSPTRRGRRSSAGDSSPKNPNAINRRKSDGDLTDSSVGLLPDETLPERLSGRWTAEIEEGKQKCRRLG